MSNIPISNQQQLDNLRAHLGQLPLPQQRIVLKVKQSLNEMINGTKPKALGELAMTLCVLERLAQQESNNASIIHTPRNH